MSITFTWCADTEIDILMGVESVGVVFTLFLEFRGGIIGAGWPALP